MQISLPELSQILPGLGLAILISALAYRLHSLSKSGAIAAVALGTVVFGLGGLEWAALLLGFFISSSGLSRLFKRRKARLEEKVSKGSRREAGQVLANGGVAGLFVILHLFFPQAIWPWLGCAGALAAANADTWATEIGFFSSVQPRLITNGRKVESGTSGGVTPLGYLAALGGSLAHTYANGPASHTIRLHHTASDGKDVFHNLFMLAAVALVLVTSSSA